MVGSSLVFDNAPFPVEIIDGGFRVLYSNQAYSKLFSGGAPGLTVLPDVLAGRPRSEILTLAEKAPWRGETEVASSGGPLSVRVLIFSAGEAESGQFAVFFEDTSLEAARRESLALQQKVLAIRSRQAQTGELLNLIAHQWRQPLTVLMSSIGNIQLKARLGSLDSEVLQGKLDKMAETIQFLSETIDVFRNFHAPSKNRTDENVTELARKALELVLPALQITGVSVELKGEPLTGPVFRGEFQQVVLELVNNARESLAGRPEPRIVIEVEAGSRCVVVKVSSNGAPIPDHVREHIFEPYYSTKDALKGLGLGLYMARVIVEEHHGGRLWVETGEWTSFSAAFPVPA